MAPRKNKLAKPSAAVAAAIPSELLRDVRSLIEEARSAVARTVNSALVLLYWHIGDRIRREILHDKRAAYGRQILSTLSKELVAEHGNGFSVPNLSRMLRFVEVFPEPAIVTHLAQCLGWSHFVEIIPLKDELQREFYAEMCRVDRWSVRTLRDKVQSMLFERTALSKKPRALAKRELDELREQDKLSPDLVFRDPYFLDFANLADTYSEKDLESALLREIQQFILELGNGFAFIERQKRIVIDGKDFYIDLLFYTAVCIGLSRWTSRSALSRLPTRDRWSSTFAG